MHRLYQEIQHAARSDINVLILGQTGSGKRLIAEAIHAESSRRKREMLRCNCSGFQGPLLESELFGHVKGAFTGAVRDRTGLFKAADESTLFLDEIGDCPLDTQAKLLLALEEEHFGRCVRRFRPLGKDFSLPEERTNVRLISATNHPLEQRVLDRQFNEALYRRINAFPICAPTASELGDDVLLIAQKRLTQLASQYNRKVTGFTTRVSDFILTRDWRDNVAGVENFVHRVLTKTALDPSDGLLDLPDDELLPEGPAPAVTRPVDSIGDAHAVTSASLPTSSDLIATSESIGHLVCDSLINRGKPLDGIMHGSCQPGPLMEALVEGMALGLQEYLKTEPGMAALRNYGAKGLFTHIGLATQKKDIKAVFPRALHARLSAIIQQQIRRRS